MNTADRVQAALPLLWLGMLLTVAGIATPSAFRALPEADAGKVAALILAREAAASLAFGAGWLALDRLRLRRSTGEALGGQFTVDLGLALGAVFCTVAGYYAIQPMMEASRRGQGPLSFASLHGVSMAFFGLKVALVAVLSWRAGGPRQTHEDVSRPPSS